MLDYKYHQPSAGILVRRGHAILLIKDSESTIEIPIGAPIEDGWSSMDWGDNEYVVWGFYKACGRVIVPEEPDPEIRKLALEQYARGEYLTGEEYLAQVYMECRHPNIKCWQDGEYYCEECPDCGYTYGSEDKS